MVVINKLLCIVVQGWPTIRCPNCGYSLLDTRVADLEAVMNLLNDLPPQTVRYGHFTLISQDVIDVLA